MGGAATALVALTAAAASPTIDATVAGLYVGQPVALEGTVTATARDGNVVHLRVGTPPQTVTVTLIEGLLSNFPPAPEQFYAGKRLRVAGTVQQFRATLEIRLLDVSGIQVYEPGQAMPVAAPPPAVAPQAVPPLPVTAPEPAEAAPSPTVQVDPQRLQDLEERIRQLESQPAAGVVIVEPPASPTVTPTASPAAAAPLPEVAKTPTPDAVPTLAVVVPPRAIAAAGQPETTTLDSIEERLKKVEIRIRHLERALENRR